MKKTEAEKLVCPFMSIGFAADISNLRTGGLIECTCITTKCMAWKATKQYHIKSGYKDVEDTSRPLATQDCEGHCMRLER